VRRPAARWARTFRQAARDGDRLVVAEELLKDVVDAEHVGQLARQAVLERTRRPGSCGRLRPGALAAERAAALADLEL
jgi:hypothetical protein